MAEKKLDPRPFFILGVLAVIAAGGWFILGGGSGITNYNDFAKCLAEEDATMYGFDACPHCNKQKNLLGREAFKQYLDDTGRYVRCQPRDVAQQQLTNARIKNLSSLEPLNTSMTQSDACTTNVGAGTPTWVINGEKMVGEQSIRDLAEASGCPLPDDYTKAEDVGGFTNRSNLTGGE